MSTTKSQALVLGASGLVGLHTTKMLLQQNTYDVIYAVSRRGIPLEHERLIQIQADFNSIDSFIDKIHINHIFSCLGSTNKKTPDKKDYIQVDHDYPLLVAKIGQSNGATKFSFVSALGANAKSNNFYMQMKGRVEEDISALNFEELHIMRPALITGNRDEIRPAERFAAVFFKIINPLLRGNFKKYRSIEGNTIAQALVKTAGINSPGVHTYNTEQIKQLA